MGPSDTLQTHCRCSPDAIGIPSIGRRRCNLDPIHRSSEMDARVGSTKGIGGNQSSSVVISGHQSSSVVISRHQSSSVVISRHQSSSVVISRHQSSSVVISRHQRAYSTKGIIIAKSAPSQCT